MNTKALVLVQVLDYCALMDSTNVVADMNAIRSLSLMHLLQQAVCRRYTAQFGETLTSPWEYVRYEARTRVRQLKRRWVKLTGDPATAPLAAKLEELARALHARLVQIVGEPSSGGRKRKARKRGARHISSCPADTRNVDRDTALVWGHCAALRAVLLPMLVPPSGLGHAKMDDAGAL